jgi:hypothetical protein
MNEGNDKSTAEGASEFTRLWFDMASQAMQAGQTWNRPPSPDAMRETRSNLFKSWSDSWDRFLRSAYFLDVEKNFVGGGAEMRKQFNEFLGKLHHEMQLATSQDVDRIMHALHRMQDDLSEQYEQVGSHLKELTSRLDDFARRMDTLETRKSPKEVMPAAERRKREPSKSHSSQSNFKKHFPPKNGRNK